MQRARTDKSDCGGWQDAGSLPSRGADLHLPAHDRAGESSSCCRRTRDGSRSERGSDSQAARHGRRQVDPGRGRSRQPVPVCFPVSVLVVCLALWPMDKISNADAYTLEQVRRADYSTNCGMGFAGLHCSEVMTCEELDYCSGHGICQRGGYCVCDPGWEGATCKQSYCPSGCSGHGACAATGGCVCDAGFAGTICDQVICLGNGNCTGHGACLEGGICACEKGYLGAACNVIDDDEKCSNHGQTAAPCPCPQYSCSYPPSCSYSPSCPPVSCRRTPVRSDLTHKMHAGVTDEHGNCKCDLWFTGPDCSLALCMNNCSDHGACDSRTGICWCDPGWTAGDCSKQLCYNNCTGHGTCFEGVCTCQDGFSGDDCSIFPCLNACSGHGACYNGTCACDYLYVEEDCSVYAGYLLDCPGNCTGRGTCMNATCHCDPGWAGLDCTASIDCPGNCTGHGMCYNATCACDLGFSGLDCAASHCLNNCTLHGTCTSNGTCACDPSWHGADCSLPELTCGVGFHGNCSGHGACMDAAVNQWWSGNSRLPDLWAWEEPSKHLVRRDVVSVGDHVLGSCDNDFYGVPTTVKSATTMAFAEEDRVMQSNGVPEHFVIHNGFPLCEVSWSISVPQHPGIVTGPCQYHWPLPVYEGQATRPHEKGWGHDALCPKPYPLPHDSPIGYALNGVPIWGPLLTDGTNAVEGSEPVPCYGHSSRTGMWHYHHPIIGCNMAANQETLLGYALDGFGIYGPLSGSKEEVDAILDKCNGRSLEDGSYRYHVRTLAQVDEGMPYQDDTKDPRNPMGAVVHNNWNYVLGCFSGKPSSSLGLRQVVVPLMTENDDWISKHDNSALSTDSLAGQLGLTSRIGLCMCDAGWVGSDCRTMGCFNNCSGNGFCEANETSAHCECDPMFEGDDCSKRINTTCSIGCSGHGTCLWKDYLNATCLCDPAWGGSNCQDMAGPPCPYNCSGHGSCFNKTCVCDHMFEGEGCQHPSAYALNLNATLCWQRIGNVLTNNSCAGRGTCFNGTCVCDAGWTGVNCTTPFVPNAVYMDCPNNCSFHGACSYVFDPVHVSYNGTCICDVGYDGPDCSIDWGAHQCDGNCSAHGSCVNKTCICDPGWDGYDCNIRWVSPYLLCPMNCSDHGSCFNGTCTCDLGWHGANCSLPDPCPGDCSGHGVCSLGNCTCDPEWAGVDCSHTSYCPGYVPELGVNCSGHGICLGGNCSCDLLWGGFDCSIPGCLNSCSNNGICRNGTCECLVGFIGEDCSMGPYDGECPGQCSGHGACSIVEKVIIPDGIADVYGDGILSGSIACVCDEGWGGSDCTIRTCPNDCSGNGACAQNGTCFCYRNWGGDDCSEAWCPSACNNRGTCMGGVGCLCDVGYDGLDCGISSCPNNCTGRGVCLATPGIEYDEKRPGLEAENGYEARINKTSSSCLCFYGWGGEDCSHITCPLNCSFPNGYCNNGTCVCDIIQGFYGRNCSEQFGVVSLRTDGNGLTPSYGIFEGRTIVTVKGTGFVNSLTMRCKFGTKLSQATIVIPNPPEVPFALCLSAGELAPKTVFFQFSLDGREWTEQDSRLRFIYHGNGIVTGVRWPTGPEQGGTTVTFYGINFQYALGVRCKFGDFPVDGSFNVRYIEDPVTKAQELEAQLMCRAPALAALNLPPEAAATVVLWVSMNMGQNWMRYGPDYFFKYYGATLISPSFGPQQDQNTVVSFYGFNLFQGENRKDLFPGFEYDYTCAFSLPWSDNPVRVKSLTSTWILTTSPYDAARFSCRVPPGLVGENGYTGRVDVGLSLNPCIYDPADTNKEYGCIAELPFTTESVGFYYVENTVNSLSLTLGPATGGTTVTIKGNHFDKRDLSNLPGEYTHPPVLCKWGTVVNEGVYNEADESVTCLSPACVDTSCLALALPSCPACAAPLNLEVAVNGQDFTGSRVQFSYHQDPQVQGIYPSLGPVLGGTTVTIRAGGFHDPCTGCSERNDCATCGNLVKCKYQAFTRVEYTAGECVKNSEGICDATRIKCLSPTGRILRGNVVSLDPFLVALSVSVNDQQFFPINLANNEPYNVYDPQCTGSRTTGCAFLYKFYENPILNTVYPAVIGGNGGGRITVTGVSFLNENEVRCRYGTVFGPVACTSGATGDYVQVKSPGQCVGAVLESPIFVSPNKIICGTVSLEPMTSKRGDKVTQSSVGISFNGGYGEWDTSWIKNTAGNIKEDAVQVYWVLNIQPTLGFLTGGTRITVTGVNLEAVGIGGDNSKMRCKFDQRIVVPNPQQNPDPVDFSGGKIECTSPISVVETGKKEVLFGICLLGTECENTGITRQAETVEVVDPAVNHFTKAIQYLYYEAPRLTALSPSLGPREGSTYITIKGEGFFKSPILSCKFDLGHYSSASTLVSSTEVVCQTPPITAGMYNMEITLNGQQFSAGCSKSTSRCNFYSYIEPLINQVNPQAGINTGGSLAILTVENPIVQYSNLRCKYQAVHPPDVERLEIEGLTMVTDASVSGSTVTCYSPSTQAAVTDSKMGMRIPILHTATVEKPLQGLTYVSLTWNGQQYGPFSESENAQRFWYHDEVEAVVVVPSSGKISDAQMVTLFGENFVNTGSLQIQWGENYYLCAPGAPTADCPADSTHKRDAITFISKQELHFRVPTSSSQGTRNVKVSNNGMLREFSKIVTEYTYVQNTDTCPNDCKGVAPQGSDGHGKCGQVGSGFGCNCNLGYSGADCSIGPMVIRLEPSIGLATGGFQVTVIGRNIWVQSKPTTGNTFKVLLDNRAEVSASQATGCGNLADCEDKLVFTVPTPSDPSGPMAEAPQGIPVEITVNGKDYTINKRRLRLMGTPSISKIVPDGAHYTGNVRVTITGSNFVDGDTIRIRLGPTTTSPPCLSELCLRAVYVSSSRIVFDSLPCLGNCNFRAPLLVRLSLNGVDFLNTNTYFRFLQDTVLTKIIPRVGAVSGGTPVEIMATNMNVTTGFACKFGDQVVLGYVEEATALLPRRVKCRSPAAVNGNGTVPVTIALDGQTYAPVPDCTSEPEKCFVYMNPLAATKVYPTLGPVQGGTRITILGSSFYTLEGVQAKCRWSTTSEPLYTDMTFVDAERYTCTSPAAEVRTYDFSFAANGADFEPFPFSFRFYQHPQLVAQSGDTVRPIGSGLAGGTVVTIRGTGFFNSGDGIRVRWQNEATSTTFMSTKATFVSDTEIVVKTTQYPYGPSFTKLSVSLNDGLDFSEPAADTFAWYSPPTLVEVIPPLGPRLGETLVVLNGVGFIGLRGVARCKFGDYAVPAQFDDSNGQAPPVFECKSPPWPVPDWVNVEIAMDGQVFTEAKNVKFQYYGEFDVYSAVPAGGPKAGGTEVTITGVGLFMSGIHLQCFFGDGTFECSDDISYPCYRAVRATFLTPTRVKCTAPEIPPGGSVTTKFPVRLGLNGQFSQACPNVQTGYQCALKSGLGFTYYEDVFVTGLTPNSGQVMGGTELTVYGTNFRTDLASSTRCMFRRCLSTDIYTSGDRVGQFRNPDQKTCNGEITISPSAPGDVGVISTTMIRCLAPLASTADTHFAIFDISLNKGITNQNMYGPECRDPPCPVMYYYYALPQLAFNSPSIGPLIGGTMVTVKGVGFIGTQNTKIRCKFGGVDSEVVQFLTESTISCKAPERAEGTVRVQVSLNGLNTDFTLLEFGSRFIYYTEPVLLDRPSPSAGPTSGGTVITIKGTGFIDGGLACKFWTGPAKGNLDKRVPAQFLTSTSASCAAPAVTQSQLVSVSLSLNGQDYSPNLLEDLYFYFPAPEVSQLIPSAGPAQSGGYAFVRGLRFQPTTSLKCRVGVIETSGQYINETFVRCNTPQIQPKAYSAGVLALGTVIPEVLPETFVSYNVQAYPLELSFDGQTFSSSGLQYVYYQTPNVDVLSPNAGPKTVLTTVAVLNGANFRNDLGGPFCRFGGVGNVRAVFMNDRTIRCQVPAVSMGRTVLVEISVNGQEYEDHTSQPYTFYGSAPILQSADFTETFDKIQLNFDYNTNRAKMKGAFECSNVLSIKQTELTVATSGLCEDEELLQRPVICSRVQALGATPTPEAMFTALYGFGVHCRFENNMTLSLVMGAYPAVKLGHPVILVENIFMRGDELTYFASANTTITSSRATVKPVALLSAPNEIGACDDLEIDAAPSSGGLGRALYFSWILDQLQSRITDDNYTPQQKGEIMDSIASAVEPFSGFAYDESGAKCQNPTCFVPANNGTAAHYKNCFCNVLKIPFQSYPAGKYTVQLTVSNWLGSVSDAASITVEKKVTNIPTVTIDLYAGDADRRLYVNQSNTIGGSARVSKCTTASASLLYKWTLLDDKEAPVDIGSSVYMQANTLVLPAYSLSAGKSFFAQLEVTESVNNCKIPLPAPAVCQDTDSQKCCAVGMDKVALKAATSTPMAMIKGSDRTVSASAKVTIDGSDSYHPDFPGSSQPTLSYGWTCADTPSHGNSLLGGCFSQEGNAFGTGTAKILEIPANSLRPRGVIYKFTLNVSDSQGWSIADIIIRPTQENVPLVTIEIRDQKPKYPPNKKITFLSSAIPASGAGATSLTYQWTTVNGDVDLSRTQFLLSPNSRESSLIVKPNVLTPGQMYSVRLAVTQNGKTGIDQITFKMDTPPSGGVFEVSPMSGTSLDTNFKLSALNWQVDADTLPITYAFEYKQQGSSQARSVQIPTERGIVQKWLPPGPASDNNMWALQVRVRNMLGSEVTVTSCNMAITACLVKVEPKVYADTDAMLADIQGRTSGIEELINAGDPNGAINYINDLMMNMNMNSGAGGTRRRSLLATDVELASMRCGTMAPLVYTALPSGGIIGYPSADSLASNTIITVESLMSAPVSQINDQCLTEMKKIYDVVLEYLGKGSATVWAEEPNLDTLQRMLNTIAFGTGVARNLHAQGSATTATRMADLIQQTENVTAIRSFGTISGEAAKTLDSSLVRSKIYRVRTPIAGAAVRGWHRGGLESPTDLDVTSENGEGPIEQLGRRQLLQTTRAGTTQIPAWAGSFTQSVWSLPATTLPFAINKVPDRVGNSGITLSEDASVSAVSMHWLNFYNPHYYSSDASQVIAPVLSLQLQAFGMLEVVTLSQLASPIELDLQLRYVPAAMRDDYGRHRVAACAFWNGTSWDTNGCSLDKIVQADSGGQNMRAMCKCTEVGQHTVLDLPAGCDGVPFSTVLYDVCRVCGGDGTSCKGCDGIPNSGATYDGCKSEENPKGVCGGDNSTCAGCDGVPNSGTVLDECSVCGGDNSTCMGCDGISVHPLVTARTGLRPKAYDSCISAQNPRGVCGGCDASCKGCDGRVNSGKLFDKCGRCGDFEDVIEAANNGVGPSAWYSRATKDNCTLGQKRCPPGNAPDSCGDCVPFGADDQRNLNCKGCDGVAGVFSYQYGKKQSKGKVVDRCGVCGGNDCSCVDCRGVVGGSAKHDRCGVCEGNNTCLDCMGTPYGVKTRDICGICGGFNDTRNCRGCDGKIYPLPLRPPQFDRNFECCAVSEIGCNNTCGAKVGCDGVCSKNAKVVDRCGVCGGSNAPNTGVCDCAGVPNGDSRIGCDGVCRNPPLVLDICGVCGGTNQSETGHCDCEGIPHGPAIRDSSGVCCYLSDMGCGSKNQSRCFSGKTWDICNTCGGDGGTCVQTRPSTAARNWAHLNHVFSLAVLLFAFLLVQQRNT